MTFPSLNIEKLKRDTIKKLEKEKQDKIDYGTSDFARSDVEGYAQDVQRYVLYITQGKFR